MSCGAKTRGGGKCKGKSMPNGRCRMHGGTNTGAPKGNENALKHGIYSRRLTDEEITIAGDIKLGTLDEEIRLYRIRLRRALEAEAAANGEAELEEVIDRAGGGAAFAHHETKKRVRDYHKIIDTITGRIESLEKTRAAFLAEQGGDDPTNEMTRDDTTIAPDEPVPEAPIL